jgi:hypothetical protein
MDWERITGNTEVDSHKIASGWPTIRELMAIRTFYDQVDSGCLWQYNPLLKMPKIGNLKGRVMKAAFASMATLLLLFSVAQAQPGSNSTKSVDDFFRDFAADWARHDPSLATSTRYFTGEEQDRVERQLTPRTLAWKRDRIQRARQGLVQLQKFDRSKMTETQRVSAEVMRWQLQNIVDEERFLDYTFPTAAAFWCQCRSRKLSGNCSSCSDSQRRGKLCCGARPDPNPA